MVAANHLCDGSSNHVLLLELREVGIGEGREKEGREYLGFVRYILILRTIGMLRRSLGIH